MNLEPKRQRGRAEASEVLSGIPSEQAAQLPAWVNWRFSRSDRPERSRGGAYRDENGGG